MNNFSLQYPQMFGWVQQLRWWSLSKVKRQTAQPLVTQAEIQTRHLAFHRACRRFAQQHPHWVQRRFDEEFLRRFISAPTLPTATELALAWDRQFGPMTRQPIRSRQMAELTGIAESFLHCYQQEMLCNKNLSGDWS